MKNSYKILCILIPMFVLLLQSCGYEPIPEEKLNYVGHWEAQDGTWITVYQSGQGDFDLGNKTVSGGKTTITDSTLTIGLMGIDQVFHITEAPSETGDGMVLVLDNKEYFR